jgi:Amt family ammonium transporter
LIFGWLSFNASSSGGYGQGAMTTSARASNMTVIAMASGGLSSTIIMMFNNKLDLGVLNNAFLGSLVAITAPCAFVDGVGAFFIGAVGGILALYGGHIPIALGIDDALDTFSVHGINGAWGLISVGLFAKQKFMNPLFGYGVFYGAGGNCLAWQIAAAVVIIAVAASVAFCTFALMYVVGKYVIRSPLENPLRVSEEEEMVGLDIKEFEGYAYPENSAAIADLMSLSSHSKGNKKGSETSSAYNSVSPSDKNHVIAQVELTPVNAENA